MFFGYGALHWMDIPIFIAFGLSIWAQFRVQGAFRKWSQVYSSSGLTGAEAARRLLDRHGLYDVKIEHVSGTLSDHYDPIHRVVRLSDSVYGSSSIAAVSVACHEVGHAIQHAVSYPMLVLRHRMFPLVNFASGVAPFLIIAGLIFGGLGSAFGQSFFLLGILFFAAAVAFQVVTLPVEFNASARARELMISEGFISNSEERGVAQVLNAAALTYVAATIIAILQLLKFILIFLSQQQNRD
jgi:hypothetical protein